MRCHPRCAVAVGLTALAVVTAGTASPTKDATPVASNPVAVSGLSPFAPGCNGAPQTGTNYRNTAVEPQFAVNPTNPDNIVAGYQQDRWSTGASNSDMVSVSHDGGRTWKPAVLPHLTHCAGGNASNGGDYERATDPWVSFSPDGTLYYVAQRLNSSNPANSMAVSRSTDGGDTWSDPVSLIQDSSAGVLNDKVSITADHADSRAVFATWDRLVTSGSSGSTARRAYRGPTMFASTTDHGATWTTRTIFDPGLNNQTVGNRIIVLPDGTLVDVFNLVINASRKGQSPSHSIALIRSTNRGATWSAPTIVSKVRETPLTVPNTKTAVRTGDAIPSVALDRRSGALYVAWQDSRFNGGGHGDAVLSRSTDGGLTWSAPTRVSQAPGAPAFTPTVRVSTDGTVAVSYYDLRGLTPGNSATLPTDLWLVRSRDAGATWSESHVAGPFNLLTAPNSSGLFLGDYMGLVSIGNSFHPLFAMTVDGTAKRTDVFTSVVGS